MKDHPGLPTHDYKLIHCRYIRKTGMLYNHHISPLQIVLFPG